MYIYIYIYHFYENYGNLLTSLTSFYKYYGCVLFIFRATVKNQFSILFHAAQ